MRLDSFAVLASGGGTNLQCIIDAIESGKIKARISAVIADRPCGALDRAKKHGIPAVLVDRCSYSSADEFQAGIREAVASSGAQAVVLAGYLSIVDAKLVELYRNLIVNIHPSLIPSFCGMGYYGERVHRAVLDYGCKVSGATVHFVDEGADTGPIIAQRTVEALDTDTPHDLAARVLKIEHELLPEVVAQLCEGRIEVIGRRVRII